MFPESIRPSLPAPPGWQPACQQSALLLMLHLKASYFCVNVCMARAHSSNQRTPDWEWPGDHSGRVSQCTHTQLADVGHASTKNEYSSRPLGVVIQVSCHCQPLAGTRQCEVGGGGSWCKAAWMHVAQHHTTGGYRGRIGEPTDKGLIRPVYTAVSWP